MKKVIIVGNGKGVLNKPNGDIIDSYDIVVRLNHYRTKSYEKYVGTKTDCWALNKCAYSLINSTPQDLIKDYKNTFGTFLLKKRLTFKEQNVELFKIKEYLKAFKLNVFNVIEEIPPSLLHLFIFDASLFDKQNYYSNYKFVTNPFNYTTGFVVLNYFIEQGYDVTITGFDFFQKSSVYWFKCTELLTEDFLIKFRTSNYKEHSFILEKHLVTKLLISKQIKILK